MMRLRNTEIYVNICNVKGKRNKLYVLVVEILFLLEKTLKEYLRNH
jgi:hypothetical protein